MNTSTENIVVYAEFAKKKVLGQLTSVAASPACRRHGRQKVLIPECNLTGTPEEWSIITLLPVRSHSGINTFCLFHVVSSPLSVLKIEILMLACQCPMHSNEN